MVSPQFLPNFARVCYPLPVAFFRIGVRLPSGSTLFPYTTLFRSGSAGSFVPYTFVCPGVVIVAVTRSEENMTELQLPTDSAPRLEHLPDELQQSAFNTPRVIAHASPRAVTVSPEFLPRLSSGYVA